MTVGATSLTSVGPALSSLSPGSAPVFQGDATAGYVLSSPQTGTVTSFSFMSAGAASGTRYALAVLRPAEPAGTWTLVSVSEPVAVTSAIGVDAANGPYPTSQAIAAGDRVGLEPIGVETTPIEVTGTTGDGVRYFEHAFKGLGESLPLAPGSTADPGQLLPLQATVSFTPPAPAAPVNVAQPRVSGTPKAGRTLTCEPGTWTNSPSYAFAWTQTTFDLVGGSKPPKVVATSVHTADGQSYVVPDLPAGVALSCTVTATNAATAPNAGPQASSPPVAVETSPPALAPSFSAVYHTQHNAPSISATVTVHGTDVCHPGIWLHYPTSFTYEWFTLQYSFRLHRFGGRVVHRGQDFDFGTAVVHHRIYCQVTAANSAGSTTAASNTVLVPFPGVPAPKAEGNPVITVVPSREVDPASSFAEPFPSGPSGEFVLKCDRSRFVPTAHITYSWELQFYRSFPPGPGAPSAGVFAPEDTVTGASEAQDHLTLTVLAAPEGPEPLLNGRPLKLPVTPWSREFAVRCATKGTVGSHNSTTVQSPVLYLISATPLASELAATPVVRG